MKAARKGIVLALVHIALIGTLGAKLMIDRSRYPRVWAKSVPFDPDLPIRGRYVRLRLEAKADAPFTAKEEEKHLYRDSPAGFGRIYRNADLMVRDGALIAVPNDEGQTAVQAIIGQEDRAQLTVPVAFFIPEHVPDPSMRPAGEELWVEVTVPAKGPPRPIQLGVKKDGTIVPLGLR
jgi:hypothetical protein